MKIVKPDRSGVALTVRCLKRGKAVVFATDTAYALGVDAMDAEAVKKLFRIKKRRPSKPVHIVVADLVMAKKYAKFTPLAERLFRKFLPGALTLILPLSSQPHPSLILLSAGTGTIGIRMPKNRVSLELVKRLGRPITATSANVSDAPTAYSLPQLARQYRWQKLRPDLILDSGKLPKIRPSTMVQLKGDTIKILRRGLITKIKILNALKF